MLRKPLAEIAAGVAAKPRIAAVSFGLERFQKAYCSDPRSTTYKGLIPPTNSGTLEYCHQSVPKKGLKLCGRHCYLRHSIEVRQPIRLAQQRLAELRTQGLDPGHGAEAAKNRGAAMALTNRRAALRLSAEERRARRAAQAGASRERARQKST
jgi:hypothetical protein